MAGQVECYAGYLYPERPAAFFWQEERKIVQQILASWQTPQGRFFRVVSEDSQVFELAYLEMEDEWQITLIG